MKKLLTTLTATLACAAAFAQGKISFQNDSLHLVYWDPSIPVVGGHSVTESNHPFPLMADLYVGTGSGTLSLVTSATWSTTAPGRWSTLNVTVPGMPGGSTVFVITQIRDPATAPLPTLSSSDWLRFWPPGAWAFSLEFQFTLGTSTIVYPPMWGTNGNWPVGTFDMSGVDGNPAGSRGAISIGLIPEPSTFALATLGAAGLRLLRRRS